MRRTLPPLLVFVRRKSETATTNNCSQDNNEENDEVALCFNQLTMTTRSMKNTNIVQLLFMNPIQITLALLLITGCSLLLLVMLSTKAWHNTNNGNNSSITCLLYHTNKFARLHQMLKFFCRQHIVVLFLSEKYSSSHP